MNPIYARYTIPTLGLLCVTGAGMLVAAARAPLKMEVSSESGTVYDAIVPERMELKDDVPTMEAVVEKHLFVKERKATGSNTFPDLLVKGVYVGEQRSCILSLKSRPEINMRVWQNDIDAAMKQVTDPRDPRQSIVDFLNEWDILEITFNGVTVEHFVTGEVETYKVDYTPTRKVADSAEAGYGQGMLVQEGQAAESARRSSQGGSLEPRPPTMGMVMGQMRAMMQNLSPEQRARLAQRLIGNIEDQQNKDGGKKGNKTKKNNKSGGSKKNKRNR